VIEVLIKEIGVKKLSRREVQSEQIGFQERLIDTKKTSE
jgi:hypothetical protein